MTKKTTEISDAEKQLFRDAVSHVKPLKATDRIEKADPIKKPMMPRAEIKPREYDLEEKTTFYFDDKQPEIMGDDVISFARFGLQHKRMTQLKQGKMRTEATLDLHRHTADEAIHAVDDFLNRCQRRGFRSVCIIHGKGHFSADNKPVLKNILNSYLRGHPCVLAFHSAKIKQGGTGAMIVMIKA